MSISISFFLDCAIFSLRIIQHIYPPVAITIYVI